MPRRARARGMPTAQPMMMGSLDFEDDGLGVAGGVVTAVAWGARTEVTTTVRTPSVPLERDVCTAVTGVEAVFTVVETSCTVFPFDVELEAPPADEAADVFAPPPFPVSEASAKPVMVARVGAEDGGEPEPMVM
jgi:hypothetical protein